MTQVAPFSGRAHKIWASGTMLIVCLAIAGCPKENNTYQFKMYTSDNLAGVTRDDVEWVISTVLEAEQLSCLPNPITETDSCASRNGGVVVEFQIEGSEISVTMHGSGRSGSRRDRRRLMDKVIDISSSFESAGFRTHHDLSEQVLQPSTN